MSITPRKINTKVRLLSVYDIIEFGFTNVHHNLQQCAALFPKGFH